MSTKQDKADILNSVSACSGVPIVFSVSFSSVPKILEKTLVESMSRLCSVYDLLRVVILSHYRDDLELKEIARLIKSSVDCTESLRGLDDKGSWQCIVGKSFGVSLSHERSYCIMVNITSGGKHVCPIVRIIGPGSFLGSSFQM